MQLELYLLQPVGYVFVVDAADEDGPLVRVLGTYARGAVVGVEGLGDGAVDYGESLQSVMGGSYRRTGRREEVEEDEMEEKRGGEGDEPKGRWIWVPLTRSFLAYLGTGMFI